MITFVLAASVMLGALAVPGEPPIHAVVAMPDGTHSALEISTALPGVSEAKRLWIWTDAEAPIRIEPAPASFDPKTLRERLRSEASRSLRIVVRGWRRKQDLGDLRIHVAPVEMWGSVPESLLPSWRVSTEGRATGPVRGAVRLRAVGKTLATSWVTVRASDSSVELNLEQAEPLDLKLVTGSAAPVRRGFVTLLVKPQSASSPSVQAQYTGDARGAVSIAPVPLHQILILAINGEGVAPTTVSGTVEQLRGDVRLEPSARVSGRFLDERNRPLANVMVEAEAWIAPSFPALTKHAARSDEKGVWVVDGLPRSNAVVRATAAGRAAFVEKVSLREIDADLGDIVLAPGATLVLDVQNGADQPVEDAEVTSDSGFRGRTASDGTVTLTGLDANEPAEITISANGFADEKVRFIPPFAERESVQMQRSFLVKGRLLAADDAPVERALIVVRQGDVSRQEIVSGGSFELPVDAGSDFELSFESPSSLVATRRELAGRAGETRDLGTIRLASGAVVRGRVVDSVGAPVRGAQVWALRHDPGGAVVAWVKGRVIRATSGEDGAFELAGVAAGPVALRIEATGYARAFRRVTAGEEALDLGSIELVPGSTVTIRLQGQEPANASIDLSGESLDVDTLTAPLVDGFARIRNVPPGEHLARVMRGDATVCERRFRVESGEDGSVECPPPGIVRGRVLVGGSPAPGGSLVWSRPGPQSSGLIQTTRSSLGASAQRTYGVGGSIVTTELTPSGTFETDRLLAGAWQVAWASEEGTTPPQSVQIPEGREVQVDVVIEGGSIRGRVVDDSGAAVPGARIREVGGGLFSMTGPDGAFAIAGVVPGAHRLQASHGIRSSRAIEVRVESGTSTPEVTLEIGEGEANAVAVLVAGEDGRPRPGAFVFLEATGGISILTADANGVARGSFPAGLPAMAGVVAFAGGSWAFAQLPPAGVEGGSREATIRIGPTGTLSIVSRTFRGEVAVGSSRAGDLSWMLARLGGVVAVAPDAPLVIGGLPSGAYEVRAGGTLVPVSISAGRTTSVQLP